jgi:hypothetical protein
VLLTREISIPSGSPQVTFLPSSCFYWFPHPGADQFKGDFGGELVKRQTRPVPRRQKATVSDP